MLCLKREHLKDKEAWNRRHISLFSFDDKKMIANSKKHPQWMHFGPGNIFRAFIASLQQELLEKCAVQTGIIAVAPYDGEVIEKIYRPHDNLSLVVTMEPDNTLEKKVIGSISESLICSPQQKKDWKRLQEIWRNPSLQIVSFTITEKGYKITDFFGYKQEVKEDIQNGLEMPQSFLGKVTALLYERYVAGQLPIALLSLDNCSHNGDKLKQSILTIAKACQEKGFLEEEFIAYINNVKQVSFPCSMIDKITPRPSKMIQKILQDDGVTQMGFICSQHQSHYAPFVNAEKTGYLVVEDWFPNGRGPLDTVGVILTDRQTVDQVERMKVCTCLNPLHTALAVFGCLLDYESIALEMQNPILKKLVEKIGYQEGMPVVTDPGVINPQDFLKEVIEVRFPNANIPDTPQRIASDTSQKIGIRFGETLKAYAKRPDLEIGELIYIPLTIAGWCRYLMGVDDKGKNFVVSPDPLLLELQKNIQSLQLGNPESLKNQLKAILSNQEIFGVDLYKIGLGNKIEAYVKEMLVSEGAVESVLMKYLR